MGVFRFFGDWVNKRYTAAVGTQVPEKVSGLSLDFNGTFHGIAAKVYQYGDIPVEEFRGRQKAVKDNMAKLNVDFLREIGNTLRMILDDIRPIEYLIIAIDGVAPLAKIQQQKQRRYKTAAQATGKGQAFDSNAFTVGTELMRDIDDYLKKWLESHRNLLPPLVINSSQEVP